MEGELWVKRPLGVFCWHLRGCGAVKCLLTETPHGMFGKDLNHLLDIKS